MKAKELFKQALKQTVAMDQGVYYFIGVLTSMLELENDKEIDEMMDKIIENERA